MFFSDLTMDTEVSNPVHPSSPLASAADSDIDDTILKPRSSYPYPVHVNVSNFVTIKLSSSNFLYWEMQFPALAESHAVDGFLTGTELPPPMHVPDDDDSLMMNPEYQAWLAPTD